MDKKGQITVYIILGLAILLVTGLMIYSAFTPSKIEIKVAPEVRPVYDLVVQCTSQLARQGIVRLGTQGGFMNIPPAISKSPNSFLQLDPFGAFKIPMWYYEGEDRTPSIKFMESELSKFVRDGLPQCLNEFKSIKDKSIKELSQVQVSTTFTDNSVQTKLDWPLEITSAGQRTVQDVFVSELDVKIKKAWQLAEAFMKTENKQKLFEKMTMDLISINPNIPVSGMEFSCSKKKWNIKDVKTELQQMLQYNIPVVRVKNTNALPFQDSTSVYSNLAKSKDKIYSEFEAYSEKKDVEGDAPNFAKLKNIPSNAPSDAYDYFHANFDVGKTSELKAGFSYIPEYGMNINVKPNNGGNMESNLVKGARKYLNFMCVNQWHFAYDIIYPVLMSVTDDTAFDKQGFTFQMVFPVLISANEGERVVFGHRTFESVDYDTEYCQQPSDKEAEFIVKGFEEGFPTATELKDAKIEFLCGLQACNLGETKAEQGKYKLTTKLPPGCANPIIKATKNGYIDKQDVLTGDELELLLTKLRTMKVEVVKHSYSKYLNELDKSSEFLSPNEDATIMISLKEEPFDSTVSYSTSMPSTLQIADKTYKYDISLTLKKDDELRGGYFFEDVPLNYKDFANKDTIILHALTMSPLPSNKDEMSELMSLARNEKFKEVLKPTFR